MKTYKIGIIGNHLASIKDQDLTRKVVKETVFTLADQYSPNRVCFNISGSPGVPSWTAESCRELGVDYQLFFPCEGSMYSQDWYPDQKQDLEKHLVGCTGLTIATRVLNESTLLQSDHILIDDSDFLIVFWRGDKYGQTYDAIKYAVDQSKIVLDGMNELKMISKAALKERQPNSSQE